MKRLLGMKLVLIPTVLFIFLISLVFTIRGIWISLSVFIGLLTGQMHFVRYEEITSAEPPSLLLLEAVDSFLLSFVFFVFSFGLYKIFFLSDSSEMKDSLPRWLRLESIFELKALLWQSVLTTLVVIFLNSAVIMISKNQMSWEFLVLPGSIMIISVALYFLKLAEKDERPR
jgi:uncharacterized membrane protein YqhA